MSKIKTLPKKLFVKIEGSGEEAYFAANDDMYCLAEMGQKIKIGTYQLVEITTAEVVVKTSGRRNP